MMRIFISILLLLMVYGCKTNVLYTDHILIEKLSGQQDTIINTYWNRFYMDEYKMEWLLKKNNIDSKEVIDMRILYTTKQKFTTKQLK
jgi:hypothetical protein